MSTKTDLPAIHDAFADVALIAATTAAAIGESSVSQWYALQAEDPEAPPPAIRSPRFVRWLAKDVAAYWRLRVERAAETNAQAVETMTARAKKASAEARKPEAVAKAAATRRARIAARKGQATQVGE